jgi:hypothetical protein
MVNFCVSRDFLVTVVESEPMTTYEVAHEHLRKFHNRLGAYHHKLQRDGRFHHTSQLNTSTL